jgi:lipoate-protein ligase A
VYFSKINHRIIEGLEELGVTGLSMRGISDISYGDLKILGSSIFRRKQRVLYHAVLNVALPVTLISRYIAHPPKEPDYRKGRSHEDFVTNLRMLGCTAEISHIANVLRKTLELPF